MGSGGTPAPPSALFPRSRPLRVLTVATAVDTVGNGVYMTAGVLFFTRAIHLPAVQVGLGLSIAGIVSLLSGIPVGHLADRLGPREVYAATLACSGLAMAAYCVSRSFSAFLVVACLSGAAQAALPAARAPLIRRFAGPRPQEFRAYLRSVSNLGISAGAVLAGFAVHADSYAAYLLLIATNAASFLACAVIVLRLSPVRPEPAAPGPRWIALRDRPYLALTALDGLLGIQFLVLTVAIPLWLVGFTAAPRWLVAATMLVNTLMVVVFQVPVSRRVSTPRAGGSAMRRAGLALLLACVIVPASAGVAAVPAAVALLGAIAVLAIGELWQAAAAFELSYELAPAHAQGQYIGVFGMGNGIADTLGPTLVTVLCVGWGRPGWYVLGGIFALTGLLAPAAVRWAERNRPHGTAPSP